MMGHLNSRLSSKTKYYIIVGTIKLPEMTSSIQTEYQIGLKIKGRFFFSSFSQTSLKTGLNKKQNKTQRVYFLFNLVLLPPKLPQHINLISDTFVMVPPCSASELKSTFCPPFPYSVSNLCGIGIWPA